MTVRLVAWGGYDKSKPRVRLLLDALRRADALESEIAIPVWQGVTDKGVIGPVQWFAAALRLLAGLPGALWRLARTPRDTPVLLPYPGTPEIFLVAVLGWITGRRIVLDAFLPLYDTIVDDRGKLKAHGLAARLLRQYERAGLRLADLILVDTDAHGQFLAREYGLDPERFITVLVGAEDQFSPDNAGACVDDLIPDSDFRKIVLFYGQLIPLHGLSTILAAIAQHEAKDLHWVIVGKGQQQQLLADFIADAASPAITWLPWVDYERLPALIARSDLCLGIFGGSGKAGRVLPNKLFQALAMGKPVITRASVAVEGLARRFPQAITTVPAEDPAALYAAIREVLSKGAVHCALQPSELAELGPDAGVRVLLERLTHG